MATSVTAPASASSREARLTAAEAASEAKEWRRAAELWDELRAEFPENVRYWNKAGEAYCHAGVFERADLVLTEAIALFPENEWAAYWSIIVARRQGVARSAAAGRKNGTVVPGVLASDGGSGRCSRCSTEADRSGRNSARGVEALPRRVLDQFRGGAPGSRA